MDLTDIPVPQARAVSRGSWFRFQRTIERTPTVLVVMSPDSIVKSAAALVLRTEMLHADWSTILDGMNLNIEVIRSRRARSSKSYVRVHLHSECVR
jgi:hypothetical protein